MEQEENKAIKKRAREGDGSGCDSPESKLKLPRVESVESGSNSFDLEQKFSESSECGENPVDSDDSGMNSPEARRIQDELLNELDDSDDPVIEGLDSVIRSFEEEILAPAGGDLTSFAGGSVPDLGYLLEASDDELGLPPTFSGEEESAGAVDLDTPTAGSGLGEMYAFEDQLPGYDSFEFGLGGESDDNGYNVNYTDGGEGFVALGGLFNHSDDGFEPADMSGLQWQAESLSAL